MQSVIIKPLEPKDVSQDYVAWMNDPEVVQYTMQGGKPHTFEDVTAFVDAKMNAHDEILFGIYVKSRHVGNIKIGPVDRDKKCADISYIIGNKEYWGRGVSTQAVKDICEYGFKKFDIDIIKATVFSNNIASQKVLQKNGFRLERIKEKAYAFKGNRVDGHVFVLSRESWQKT
ncbi:MAG: GNAT family N-acetyltransferase [Bdellovibrionales bacterium]